VRRTRRARDTAEAEREAVLAGLRSVDQRFEAERERHEDTVQAIRPDMHALLARGTAAGVGVTSMSKALGISRGRLNRIIRDLAAHEADATDGR
jgi:hypothetical protein